MYKVAARSLMKHPRVDGRGRVPQPSPYPRNASDAHGEHSKVIQERLGHASIKTALDTHGHLFDGLAETAADRLDESWRNPDADLMRTHTESKVTQLPGT